MAAIWIDSAADLQPGDVIAQQFGADFPAIERLEWLDDDRIRLHFVNMATGRVKVSGGRIRLQRRALVKDHCGHEACHQRNSCTYGLS